MRPIWEMIASEQADYLVSMPPKQLIEFAHNLDIPPSHEQMERAILRGLVSVLAGKLHEAVSEQPEVSEMHAFFGITGVRKEKPSAAN